MLIIKKAEFLGVFVDIKLLPDEGLPEIAIVGRSNVGKSSLINKLANRRNLAKSSSTPGKTRTINYYLINEQFYLVDLPGYGYAKVSKTEKLKWNQMMENYLAKREQLRGVIQLVDIRHAPSENDILMKEWLGHHNIPILIVANKMDKISRGARQQHNSVIQKSLGMQADEHPLGFSAQNGEGVDELLAALEEILEVSENV